MQIEININLGLAVFFIESKSKFAISLSEYYDLECWQFHSIIRKMLNN